MCVVASPPQIDFTHFHWGSHNQRGSEHYLMGKSYPMEVGQRVDEN